MKKIICFVLIMVVILSCDIQSFAITSIKSKEGETAESVVADTSNNSKKYDDFLKNNAFGSSNKSIVISSDCIEENNEDMVFSVDVNSNYRYYLKFKYTILDNLNTKITCSIFINDELQYDELTNCALTREYKDDGEFLKDVYDNEIKPNQISSDRIIESYIHDYAGLYNNPLSINLVKGNNTFKINGLSGKVKIETIVLEPVDSIIKYSQYKEKNSNLKKYTGENIIVEAENAKYKSDTTLYPIQDTSDSSVSPSDPCVIKLNSIGGSSWKNANQYIEWEISVKDEGLYSIGLKARQNINAGQTVNRELYINGEIPFEEAKYIKIKYNTSWQNVVISDKNNNPYLFHLNKGTNVIRLQVTLGENDELIRKVDKCVEKLNLLYRKLLVVLGTDPDTSRDYKLEKIMPDVIKELGNQAGILEDCAEKTEKYNGGTNSGSALMRTMTKQLKEMSQDSDEIAKQFTYFKTNIGSLGTWQSTAKQQPLKLDYICIGKENLEMPKAKSNLFAQIIYKTKQFLSSFTIDYKNIGTLSDNKGDSIKAWIAGGRDQAQVIRNMIGDSFTSTTGNKVKLELVSAASLLPATVAGNGPDVYLGATDVVNFAMRNAAYDISKFDDFEDVSNTMNPVLFVPFKYRNGTYGIPYSVSCLMLFYRTDIFEELGITPPQTWQDVVSLSSVLSTNSMSFGLPTGYSTFVMMLKQKGLQIYNSTETKCLIDSVESIEVFRYFTDFYNNYGFPLSYNFVNRFRTGEMPIAVAELENYNTLQISAPEIKGLWKITNVPGYKKADGTINNLSLATPKAAMILQNSKNPDASWEFIKWWVSSDTQIRYSSEIESVLGPSGRYTSAITSAFRQSLWNSDEKKEIEYQLDNLCALEQVPGGYFLSRHLNNAFRNVVYYNKKPMDMLFDYADKINSEIKSKRNEFNLALE